MTEQEIANLRDGDVVYDEMDIYVVTRGHVGVLVDTLGASTFVGLELRLPPSLLRMDCWHIGFAEETKSLDGPVTQATEETEPACLCKGSDPSAHDVFCEWKKWNDKRRATWGLQK